MCGVSFCFVDAVRTRRVLLVVAMLSLAACAGSVLAQTDLGELTLGGPGVALLESAQFQPTEFTATPDTWTFCQAVPGYSLLVAPNPVDPTEGVIVGFVELGGESWSFIDLAAGVPGLSIDGRDIVFNQVTLPLDAGNAKVDELILDGVLTRPEQVGSDPRSLGAFKSAY